MWCSWPTYVHQVSTLFLLLVHRCPVLYFRRRTEFRMLEEPSVLLSDQDLNAMITEMRMSNPAVQESIVTGYLQSRGYQINRERVRQALWFTDPLSSALRWPGGLTHQRPYSVAGPNSLWHIGMTLYLCVLCSSYMIVISMHHYSCPYAQIVTWNWCSGILLHMLELTGIAVWSFTRSVLTIVFYQ